LPGSLAVCAACHRRGVEFVRVHDVADTVAFLRTLSSFGGVDDEGASCRT
jgi:dihydropteroate synthase